MELLNVFDSNGNVIGSKDKNEVYKDGDIHGTVHIWILNSKGELLLQKRNPKKETFANLWAISTAGHVRKDEAFEKTAIRELKEELNQDVKIPELEYLFKLQRHQESDEFNINTIDKVYLLRRDIDVDHTKLQKSELTDIKFIKVDKLKEMYEANDEELVPASEEHTLLFEYLKHNLEPEVKTTTQYNYDLYSKLCLFNTRYNISNLTLTLLFLILLVIGFVNHNWLFYFAIFTFIIFVFSIEPRARQKANKVYGILGYDAVHEEDYEFYGDVLRINGLALRYNQLLKVCEFKDDIYLYINPKQAFIIKNSEKVKKILKEKTNYKRYSK